MKMTIKKYFISAITLAIGTTYQAILLARELLNIRFYFRKKRILEKFTNEAIKSPSGKYCIYSIYQPNGITRDHRLILDYLLEHEVNVICVYSGDYDDNASINFIRQKAYIVLLRHNIGRDFGAYKDGLAEIEMTQRERKDLKRLLFINDSIFIRENGLDSFINRLFDTRNDVVAPFETFQIEYHIQSFCISVSADVYSNNIFQSYWESYAPFSSRKHTIKAGEKEFSKTLRKITKNIDIIYSPQNLSNVNAIFTQENELNYDFIFLLPTEMKIRILIKYNSFLENIIGARAGNESYKLTYTKNFFNTLNDQIINEVAMLNSAHYLSAVFSKYLHCPIMKKDIFYRQVYRTFPEICYVLDTFFENENNEELKREAIQRIRQFSYAGSGASFIKRSLISKGYI